MEPAVYTLIGALGGVMITQVANYFLEDKKSKSQRVLKSLELEHVKQSDLMKERRIAYSSFLHAADKSFGGTLDELRECTSSLYGAIIVSSSETTQELSNVFSIVKKSNKGGSGYLEAKQKLLAAMQKDLQS